MKLTTKKRIGVTRKKADELIRDLIQRADQINASNEFLYKVTRLEIFGSYLTDKGKLGDIDIAVKLDFKNENEDLTTRAKKLIEQSRDAPSSFQGWASAFWASEKVMRALKARHTSFSFHSTEELDQMKEDNQAIGRQIYPVKTDPNTPAN